MRRSGVSWTGASRCWVAAAAAAGHWLHSAQQLHEQTVTWRHNPSRTRPTSSSEVPSDSWELHFTPTSQSDQQPTCQTHVCHMSITVETLHEKCLCEWCASFVFKYACEVISNCSFCSALLSCYIFLIYSYQLSQEKKSLLGHNFPYFLRKMPTPHLILSFGGVERSTGFQCYLNQSLLSSSSMCTSHTTERKFAFIPAAKQPKWETTMKIEPMSSLRCYQVLLFFLKKIGIRDTRIPTRSLLHPFIPLASSLSPFQSLMSNQNSQVGTYTPT